MTCSGVNTILSIPSTSIIDTSTTARGYACTRTWDPVNCAHVFTLPTVVDVARQYFNCSSLTGVEIENQDGNCGGSGESAQGGAESIGGVCVAVAVPRPSVPVLLYVCGWGVCVFVGE